MLCSAPLPWCAHDKVLAGHSILERFRGRAKAGIRDNSGRTRKDSCDDTCNDAINAAIQHAACLSASAASQSVPPQPKKP